MNAAIQVQEAMKVCEPRQQGSNGEIALSPEIDFASDIAHYSNPIGNSEEEHAAGTTQFKQDAARENKTQRAISDDETGAGSSSLDHHPIVRTVFKNRQAKKEAARAARVPQGVDAVIPEL